MHAKNYTLKRTVVLFALITAAYIAAAAGTPAAFAAGIKLDGGTVASSATGVSAVISGGAAKAGGKGFVTVTGGTIDIKVKMRFAIIVGFHHTDVLYDPTVCKSKKIYAAAENFLMLVPEGGKSAFVVAWPKGSEAVPVLNVEGNGAAARFSSLTVNSAGKPVFVGVLDGVAYVDGLAAKATYSRKVPKTPNKFAEIKTGFKPPFNATWKACIARPVGEASVKWDLPMEASPSGMSVRKFGFPRKMREPTVTYVWDDVTGRTLWPNVKLGGEWTLHLAERFGPWYAAVLYPQTGGGSTLTDLLVACIGKKEFSEIIIAKELQHRKTYIPRGEPSIPATCAGYAKVPKTMASKSKDVYMTRIKACYNFCYYNYKRIEHYQKFSKELAAHCKEKSGDAKLKATAERVIKYCGELGTLWKMEHDHYRHKFLKGIMKRTPNFLSKEQTDNLNLDDKFIKHVYDYYVKAYSEHVDKGVPVKKLCNRSHWTGLGGVLDGILLHTRRRIQRIAQEASMTGIDSPEARAFAIEIRKKARVVLGAPHYKEGVGTAASHASIPK